MSEDNDKPIRGSVDALEYTLKQLGIESIIATTKRVAGKRTWRIVLVADSLKTFTGEGRKFEEAARFALKSVLAYRAEDTQAEGE